MDQGNHMRAEELGRESLMLRRKLGEKVGIAQGLEALAVVASSTGRSKRALLLAAAAEALRETIKALMPPCDRPCFEVALALARGQVGTKGSAADWDRGRALSLKEAVEYALSDSEIQLDPPATRPAELTQREREVATLVAHGLSDREIAGPER